MTRPCISLPVEVAEAAIAEIEATAELVGSTPRTDRALLGLRAALAQPQQDRAGQWIACAERMPEEGRWVLGCGLGRTVYRVSLRMSDLGGWWTGSGLVDPDRIDHWQPLPAPPSPGAATDPGAAGKDCP